MADELQFFFSYARANRDNAWSERPNGERYNLVDDFFKKLCKEVSDITSLSAQRVGYMDRLNLGVNSPWPNELADALQSAPVMISLVTPHYLGSVNCGREFEVFRSRYELVSNGGTTPSPIIPIFWANEDDCWRFATEPAREFLKRFHWTSPQLPDNYPAVGLSRQIRFTKGHLWDHFCICIADTIKSLANRKLPALSSPGDFHQLPSAFDQTQSTDRNPVEPSPIIDLSSAPMTDPNTASDSPPRLDLGS